MDSIVMSAGRKASEVIKKVEQLTYSSGRQCFRAHSIKNDDPVILRGCFKIPTIKAEPPKPCIDWTYLSKEAFQANCLKRESGYISGIAGVGKSYTMLEITKELEQQGVVVKKLAKCHVAALNISGQTADSFLHKYQNGGFSTKKCCIVLEEVCTLDTRLLAALAKRKRMGVQFICLGCPNQHLPINNAANGLSLIHI